MKKEFVKWLEKLVRVELNEEEKRSFETEFASIIEYFNTLKDLKIPTFEKREKSLSMFCPERKDVPRPTKVAKEKLTNNFQNGYFKVPKII